MTDFSTTFAVDETPIEAFNAISNPRGWWSEVIEGDTTQSGSVFYYHAEDLHRCTIRVTEATAGKRVSWLVLNNYFNFTADKTEWNGTTINFDISVKEGRTEIRFTHQGLVAAYECFDICSNAWTFYVNTSLHNLIATGEGQPNTLDRLSGPVDEAVAS
jgi:hypothetical protein